MEYSKGFHYEGRLVKREAKKIEDDQELYLVGVAQLGEVQEFWVSKPIFDATPDLGTDVRVEGHPEAKAIAARGNGGGRDFVRQTIRLKCTRVRELAASGAAPATETGTRERSMFSRAKAAA